MSEVILYACASALLCGLVPSFMKTGVRRAAPSVAAALYATVAFLFAFGAAAISGTLGSLLHIDNAALLNLALDGLLDALVWLCLFTALSTGGVNRVMPIHNLAAAGAIGLTALLSHGRVGVWRLCCIVLLLLGTVLMESRQRKERGYQWLLFSCLALAAAAAQIVYEARCLPDVPGSVQRLLATMVAMVLLWCLSAAGKSLNGIKKLQLEDWLFLLLAGVAAGLAGLCDTAAERMGDSSYLLPISCCAFPLMMLFARIFHKEKMPSAAVIGLLLAVFGMFGMLLNV